MMNKTIRHLEHHFHVNGRVFVVYVFNKNQPSSKLFRQIQQKMKIDVSVYSYQPADVENAAPDELRAMTSLIVGNIKSCLPLSVPPAQWIQFENAVSHWIFNRRRVQLRVFHESWMNKLARRIGLASPKTT